MTVEPLIATQKHDPHAAPPQLANQAIPILKHRAGVKSSRTFLSESAANPAVGWVSPSRATMYETVALGSWGPAAAFVRANHGAVSGGIVAFSATEVSGPAGGATVPASDGRGIAVGIFRRSGFSLKSS